MKHIITSALMAVMSWAFYCGGVLAQDATVAEDRRLGLSWQALSANGNITTLDNVTYTVTPPTMATVEMPVEGDNPAVDFFLRPTGALGQFSVVVSGTNRGGANKSSQPYVVEVVVGAAETIEVAAIGEFMFAGLPELPRSYVDTTFDPNVMRMLAARKDMIAKGIAIPNPVHNDVLLQHYYEYLGD